MGSISFKIRRMNGSSTSKAHLSRPAAISGDNRTAEVVSTALATPETSMSEYFDAQEPPSSRGSSFKMYTQAHSQSIPTSPQHRSTSPRGPKGNAHRKCSTWLLGPTPVFEPQNKFLSPEASSRHPGLQEYTYPPATHPILNGGGPHSVDRASRGRPVSAGRGPPGAVGDREHTP